MVPSIALPASSSMAAAEAGDENRPDEDAERAALDLYDAQGRFIGRIMVTGDRHAVSLDLRQVVPLLLACSCPCAFIVLRHRHPSGHAEPSKADIATTRAFVGMLHLLGIRLHDHLIEGGQSEFSFRAEGLL